MTRPPLEPPADGLDHLDRDEVELILARRAELLARLETERLARPPRQWRNRIRNYAADIAAARAFDRAEHDRQSRS